MTGHDPGGILVGREGELAVLDGVVAAARAGTPQLVLVEGPAGVGKSAVLRHLAARVVPEFVVLVASGEEVEQRLDLGIVDQLVREARAAGLTAPAPVTRATARPDPLLVGAALLDLVEIHAAGRPVLVVVDDAQWADVASLHAITYVIRRLRAVPMLLALGHRPDAANLEPLRRLVRDGAGGARVRLAGLPPASLRDLVRARVGIELTLRAAERLHAHTAGSPLEALTLAEELGAERLATGFGPLPAPRSYTSLVISRLAQCSEPTESVVAAVAVLGRPSDGGELAQMLGGGAVTGAVSAAVERGLLRVESRAGRRVVDVAHPLLRAAMLDDLPPARLAALHTAAASVTDDEDRKMLHRIRAVLGHDRELAAAAVALARRRLAAGWEESAIELLVAAAGLLPIGAEHAEASLLAADRLLDIGDHAAAAELIAGVRPGDGGALEHLVRGRAAFIAGDPGSARSELGAAWDAAEDPQIAARAAGLRATISANAGQADSALRWARRALERGVPVSAAPGSPGPATDLGHAMTMLASAWALRGDLQAGRREVEDWIGRVVGHAARADGLLARGVLALWEGRLDEAVDALAAVDSDGPLLTTATAAYSRADADYRRGRWDDALRRAERLAATLADLGQPLAAPMAHGVAAFVLAARGAFADAELHLADGRRALAATGTVAGGLWIEIGAARAAIACGDHAAAVEHLTPLAAALRGVALPEGVQPMWADLVESLVAVGRLDDAADALGALDDRLQGGGAHARAGAARARGLLSAAAGDEVAAAAAYAAGLGEPADVTGWFVRARLELAAGAFERRRGQRRVAATLLAAARDRFVALGATPFAARASQELDGCGLTPRGRGDAGAAALTPSEEAVAALVASGRTNREAASELVVSVKTIESHLARVFTKLGVRSRTELANAWRRRDAVRS